MKIVHISALAALVVASQVAFAQAPMGAPGSGPTTTTTTTVAGGGAAAGDPGSVSNIGSSTTSDTTTFDSSTDAGLTDTGTATKGEMANTGGEPQLMLMAGLVLAACGLLLRRKAAGQAI